PDGERLLIHVAGTVYICSVADGEQSRYKVAADATTAAFSRDGKRLATGHRGGTINLWDTDNGRKLLAFKGHREKVTSLAFSPDGTRIASGSADGIIKLWDARYGPELLTLKGHTDIVEEVTMSEIAHLEFSPDGSRLASATSGEIH